LQVIRQETELMSVLQNTDDGNETIVHPTEICPKISLFQLH
jgi:hypothetical protein